MLEAMFMKLSSKGLNLNIKSVQSQTDLYSGQYTGSESGNFSIPLTSNIDSSKSILLKVGQYTFNNPSSSSKYGIEFLNLNNDAISMYYNRNDQNLSYIVLELEGNVIVYDGYKSPDTSASTYIQFNNVDYFDEATAYIHTAIMGIDGVTGTEATVDSISYSGTTVTVWFRKAAGVYGGIYAQIVQVLPEE